MAWRETYANQLKHSPQVTRQQAQAHGTDDQRRCENHMAVAVPSLAGEIVILHDLAADKRLERQRSQHVEPKAQARDVDEDIVGREVVEHVALGFVSEAEITAERHEETGDHGHGRAEVGDLGEAVEGWLFEGAVDEEGVVVCGDCLALRHLPCERPRLTANKC